MFTVRPYREEDAQACGDCFYEGFFTCQIDQNDRVLLQDYAQILIEKCNFTYVAETEDHQVVGFISGKYSRDFNQALAGRCETKRHYGRWCRMFLKFYLKRYNLSSAFQQQFDAFSYQLRERDEKIFGKCDLELVALSSKKSYRKGLGTALVARFLKRAEVDGAVRVRLFTNTLASWEFYEKRGFAKAAETPFRDGSGNRSLIYEYLLKQKGIEYVTVAREGFCGFYHAPEKDVDPKKAVIVVGGSEGNENIPRNVGAMFARRGIAALGVCYWNVDGLPKELVRVPVDPFEKAIRWLKNRGHEKIIMYGISKGAELALLCASLMPDISGVAAISPMHCIWGGMHGNKSMAAKTFSSASEFTYRGKDFPCMTARLRYGPAIRSLILRRQFELSYIYEEPLKHFDEAAAIPVENIRGNILFIYAKEDLMWPSRDAVIYMCDRLEKHQFAFRVDMLEYEKASHILVPLNPPKLNMFKIERKYPDECRRSREDAFEKTVKWISDM